MKRASLGGTVIWQDASWTPPFRDLLSITNWEETPGRPRTCQRDYIPNLASWVPQEKLDCCCGNTLLSLLPLWPNPRKADEKMDGWMDGWMMFTLHVYNLTFMLGGEGDGGEVTARREGCQVSDRSLWLYFSLHELETTPREQNHSAHPAHIPHGIMPLGRSFHVCRSWVTGRP